MTCELLQELKAIGVEVIPQGENLAIRPASRVPPELKARLREHKAEVLAALKARPATCAASCYEIEPGKWIHHPWDGCKAPTPKPDPARQVLNTCWHCAGRKTCNWITCLDSNNSYEGPCGVCRGSGEVMAWLH